MSATSPIKHFIVQKSGKKFESQQTAKSDAPHSSHAGGFIRRMGGCTPGCTTRVNEGEERTLERPFSA